MEQVSFRMPLTPAVKAIMASAFAVWLLFVIAIQWVGSTGAGELYVGAMLHPATADPSSVWDGRLWQLVTYAWLHDLATPFHLLFNLLVLYFFGGTFEQRWGTRWFVQFYLICAAGAAVVSGLAAVVAPSLFGAPVVGASGAVLGLIAAFATLFPEQQIYLFMMLPLRGKYLIPLVIGIDLLMFLPQTSSVAFAAHLGGLLTGWLLVTGFWRPRRLIAMIRSRSLRARHRRGLRVVGKDDRWIH
ncbi:MAG: hypothetical protein AMXMBFR64_31870 [Myxococcales bacterium]